jgi:hypothetical protein
MNKFILKLQDIDRVPEGARIFTADNDRERILFKNGCCVSTLVDDSGGSNFEDIFEPGDVWFAIWEDREQPGSEQELTCKKCGAIGTAISRHQFFQDGTKHVRAECCYCGAFIQYLPEVPDEDFVWPFPKHKGERLADIAKQDRGYLQFMLTIRLGQSLRRRIERILGDEK